MYSKQGPGMDVSIQTNALGMGRPVNLRICFNCAAMKPIQRKLRNCESTQDLLFILVALQSL